MDRPILYPQSQVRTYDSLSGYEDNLIALSNLFADLGRSSPALAGFAPSYNGNLTVTFAAGRIYQSAQVDNSVYGSLPQNTVTVIQQGQNPIQTLTFTTAGLSSGQSQWVLVEVAYAQADVVPAGDPTSGVLTYANPANPTQPYIGPNNAGTPQPTLRNAQANIQLKYGTAATTGSEVTPAVDAGYVPMYLVLLTFGQTSIVAANLFVAGPAVTPNPPTYVAPFFSGMAGAFVYQTTAQSIPNATFTAVLWDTEVWKTVTAFHSTSSNTSRLVVGQPGIHFARVTTQVAITGNATGIRTLIIYRNGVSMTPTVVQAQASALTATSDIIAIVSPILTVQQGDYFEVYLNQSSGGSLSLLSLQSWAQLEILS